MGHRIATLLGKPADREDGRLVLQGTIFPTLEFRLLILRGEGECPGSGQTPEGMCSFLPSLLPFTGGPGQDLSRELI